jgi:hypothetical protein
MPPLGLGCAIPPVSADDGVERKPPAGAGCAIPPVSADDGLELKLPAGFGWGYAMPPVSLSLACGPLQPARRSMAPANARKHLFMVVLVNKPARGPALSSGQSAQDVTHALRLPATCP